MIKDRERCVRVARACSNPWTSSQLTNTLKVLPAASSECKRSRMVSHCLRMASAHPLSTASESCGAAPFKETLQHMMASEGTFADNNVSCDASGESPTSRTCELAKATASEDGEVEQPIYVSSNGLQFRRCGHYRWLSCIRSLRLYLEIYIAQCSTAPNARKARE